MVTKTDYYDVLGINKNADAGVMRIKFYMKEQKRI